MKLGEILSSLTAKNIRYLIDKLRLSNDNGAKRVYLKLLAGKDLFESLVTDQFSAAILKAKNLESLQALGAYLMDNENLNKSFYRNLYYPIILFFLSAFSSLLFKYFLQVKIQIIYILIAPITVILSILYLLMLCRKKFLAYLRVWSFLMLLQGKLNFSDLKTLQQKLNLNLEKVESLPQLAAIFLGHSIQYISLEYVQHLLQEQKQNYINFLEFVPSLVSKIALSTIAITIGLIYTNLFTSLYNYNYLNY